MADIAMQIDIAAPASAVYEALTTTAGVAGWWTTKNDTSGTVGAMNSYWFPGMSFSWDLRVDEARPDKLVAWHCLAGPPEWEGTDVRWTLSGAPDGFAEAGPMYRIVTLGWAQMLLRLKSYLESGQPTPFFTL